MQRQSLIITSLPRVLFKEGSHTVMEGSVIWLYCQVNSIAPTLTVTWTKDSVPLVQDAPHIRIRPSNTATSSTYTLLLVVDNFQGSDNGTYQCTAEDRGDTVTGTALTLRGSLMMQQFIII